MAAEISAKKSGPEKSAREKKRGLGRGLDLLLSDTPAASATTETDGPSSPTHEVPIEFLRPNADQPRKIFNPDAIAELAASIRARGLLQPILVRPLEETGHGGERYEIVAGERRWRAAQQAQLHTVPILVRALSDEETAEIALVENVQRVDLNPMEEAEAYHFLHTHYKRSQKDIAAAVGKSRSHIANLMRLLDLTEEIREQVRGEKLSMGHARALLSSPAPEADMKTVLSRDLSVRQTEALVRSHQESKTGAGKSEAGSAAKKTGGSSQKDADTRGLERNLAEILGLEVDIQHTAKTGSGTLTIGYLDLDQLDDVCRRLMGTSV